MTRLVWNAVGTKRYENGIDRGVLYLPNQTGVAWPGIVSVDESPDGGTPTPVFLDGVKYLNVLSKESFNGVITAISSPSEFAICEGISSLQPGLSVGQQPKKPFGFSYRTQIGNDVNGPNYGYKIHLLYNVLAATNNRSSLTEQSLISAPTNSWTIKAEPLYFNGQKPAAHLIIDSTTAPLDTITEIESILYGDADTDPRLITQEELKEFIVTENSLTVIDNGNGTFSVTGPDSAFTIWESTFQITSDAVKDLSLSTFQIRYL